MLLVIWGAAQVRSLVTGEGFDHHPVYVAMPITAAAWFFFGFFMEKGWGKAAFIASLVVIGVFIGLLVLGSSGDPCEDFKGDPATRIIMGRVSEKRGLICMEGN